tara:strand:- start:1300 stop:1641 length:342 start_codon:yes stop_codon:yes gene_type:complete
MFKKILIILSTLGLLYANVQLRAEMIPYRLTPSADMGCHLDIEIIQPIQLNGLPKIHSDEVVEVIYDRIAYELTNPFARSEMFSIDGKWYYLIRVPYTGAEWIDNSFRYMSNE